MDAFASETGLESAVPPRRYLWTDAFAVCNDLTLYRRTGERRHLERALALVDQVHHVLGRHRPDDPRKGWISGLGEQEGERRPTAGGLRIGKPMNERGPHDPADPRLEWEQDGQYYHYLTRWMHALGRASAVSGDARYLTWAVELAKVAQRAFTYPAGGGQRKRMVWKMSIDLSRPLVPSMGHHDPLDGLLTLATLAWDLERAGGDGALLLEEMRGLQALCDGRSWATDDPLGIGGLLQDVQRAFRLARVGCSSGAGLLEELLADGARSLEALARSRSLSPPAAYRLPFREMGLSIGLAAVERVRDALREEATAFGRAGTVVALVEELARYLPVRSQIESFWLDPEAQEVATWTDHLDINRVMLSTSLAPDEYLGPLP